MSIIFYIRRDCEVVELESHLMIAANLAPGMLAKRTFLHAEHAEHAWHQKFASRLFSGAIEH